MNPHRLGQARALATYGAVRWLPGMAGVLDDDEAVTFRVVEALHGMPTMWIMYDRLGASILSGKDQAFERWGVSLVDLDDHPTRELLFATVREANGSSTHLRPEPGSSGMGWTIRGRDGAILASAEDRTDAIVGALVRARQDNATEREG